jgi:hypothetical protein
VLGSPFSGLSGHQVKLKSSKITYSGGEKGYTLHVYTAGGGEGYTLHVHFAGAVDGYTLQTMESLQV